MNDRQAMADTTQARLSPRGRALLLAGALLLLCAGLLMWRREGASLFTDSLIAAIVACF